MAAAAEAVGQMTGRSGGRRWPYGRVEIVGRSMEPALQAGDWWIVRWTARVAVGDIVVAQRPDRRGLLVVKRVAEHRPAGWWLVGDNTAYSDDSNVFGAVSHDGVLGVLRWRYRRG
ncbi:MAG: S26 family signal peptidase [Actinomycetes bacterium]